MITLRGFKKSNNQRDIATETHHKQEETLPPDPKPDRMARKVIPPQNTK